MLRHITVRMLVLLVAMPIVLSCGDKETPEQKLERLRYSHKITPLGYTTIFDAEGANPMLLIDLRVVNDGAEMLDHLTVLVRVNRAGGAEQKQRVTLDLSDVRPGIGVQMSSTVPGLNTAQGDEVLVEIEQGLPAEELRGLPEFAEVAGAS